MRSAAECTRGATGTKDVIRIGNIGCHDPTLRIARLADSIDMPARLRHRGGASAALGPSLVAGRGIEKRRPRSPLSSLLWRVAYLILGAGIALLANYVFAFT